MRLQMAVGDAAMTVRLARRDADEIKLAVPDAPFGNHFLGKFAHAFHRAFEHDRFNALLVVEVGMHSRNRQVMMSVLNSGQPSASSRS